MTMSSIDMMPPKAENRACRRWRDIAILAGLFGFVIVGLAGLAAATGWQETLHQVSKLNLWQVCILLILSLVNYGFRGLRWHFFANKIGLPTTVLQDLRHFVGGFALSVTPGRLGELIRMRWIKRETGWAVERTAPLALMDRASDLAAMALILAIGLALGTGGIKYGIPVVIIALFVAALATRPALIDGAATTAYRLTGLFPRLMVKFRHASQSLIGFSNPVTLILTLGFGMIGWIAEGAAFHLLLTWMGADIGIWTAITIFTFSTLAGGLTGAPGGVGGAEAAMIALLMLQGIPLEVSVPATAIIRVTTLWFAILLGFIVFPIAERKSLKLAQ